MLAKPNETTKTTAIHTAVQVACVVTALNAVVTPTMPEAEKKSMQMHTATVKNSSPHRPARMRPTSAIE